MRDVKIELYQTKKILNVHKHSDDAWFWCKYSAYPYKGCVHGCRYCYCWDMKYAPHADYRLLDKVVMVKQNAVELLKKELPKKPRDVAVLGDWQPVEAKYKLSRKMLEVAYQLRYPVMIIERAPLLTRDLDILSDINKQTDAYVGLSIVTARDDDTRRHFEPRGPSTGARFRAMKRIADAGILVGTLAMPILPHVFDSDEELEELVRRTADSGGKYVLFGGMTLWGTCKDVYFEALKEAPGIFPSGSPQQREAMLWGERTDLWDTNKAKKTQWVRRCHLTIAEECERRNITHYIPRPVSFHPQELRRNKLIAARLFIKARDMDMEGQSSYRSRAYFKAGRTVSQLLIDLGTIYGEKGRAGLLALEGIGEKLASEIERHIKS